MVRARKTQHRVKYCRDAIKGLIAWNRHRGGSTWRSRGRCPLVKTRPRSGPAHVMLCVNNASMDHSPQLPIYKQRLPVQWPPNQDSLEPPLNRQQRRWKDIKDWNALDCSNVNSLSATQSWDLADIMRVMHSVNRLRRTHCEKDVSKLIIIKHCGVWQWRQVCWHS